MLGSPSGSSRRPTNEDRACLAAFAIFVAVLVPACAPRVKMDELATDDVQGVGRRYQYAGQPEIDNLRAALRSDQRGRVRANAVTALVSCFVFSPRKDELLPLLLRALEDRDPDVETRAAEGLAVSFLTAPDVRPALARHVASLRVAVASKDEIVQTHAIAALQQMGERPPTAGMLGAVNGEYRREGIEQAKATNDASVVPLLVQIAKADPEEVIRMEAVPVAARLAPPATRDAFLAALIDGAQPDHVVEAAIQAAVDTGAVAVAPQLRQIASDRKSGRTAAAAVAALQAFEGKH